MLEPGYSEKIVSPLLKDVDLLRTGSIPDGNCIFHSILQCVNKEYDDLNVENKSLYARKAREKMSTMITEDVWETHDGGYTSSVSFQEEVNKILKLFYGYTNNTNGCPLSMKYNKNECYLLSSLIDMDVFEKHILHSSYKNCYKLSIEHCIVGIISNTVSE